MGNVIKGKIISLPLLRFSYLQSCGVIGKNGGTKSAGIGSLGISEDLGDYVDRNGFADALGRMILLAMPTEEVYSLPLRDGVDGRVYATKPLNYNGNLIEDICLDFKVGKVTAATASKGQELLQQLIATDEGSARLGEVALVPFDSPISRSGILFFNTLFDENAACHLALGKAYPT